jgi:hypothetical protein
VKLNELLKNGLYLVQESPNHDLKVAFRCQLLSSFDEDHPHEIPHNGHQKRVNLAIKSIQKVLPLWEASFVNDRMPHEALNIANETFAGALTAVLANEKMNKLWSYCDDLSFKYQDRQDVVMVGYGAVQAIREAVSQGHFGCEGVTEVHTDMDIDPYDHDSSFCAAVAYCGGPPWDARSDSKKRMEFWTWWLNLAFEISQ